VWRRAIGSRIASLAGLSLTWLSRGYLVMANYKLRICCSHAANIQLSDRQDLVTEVASVFAGIIESRTFCFYSIQTGYKLNWTVNDKHHVQPKLTYYHPQIQTY
jgi:hypothetical protein